MKSVVVPKSDIVLSSVLETILSIKSLTPVLPKVPSMVHQGSSDHSDPQAWIEGRTQEIFDRQ